MKYKNIKVADIPDMMRYWHPDNIISPKDISKKDTKNIILWICEKGHKWESTAANKCKTCPFCTGQRICENNSLSAKYPELITEWSKSNLINPSDVSPYSHKSVLWECSNGHKWQSIIKNRTIKKTGCPYCSGQKTTISNCIATKRPDLASEFHQIKNKDMTIFNISYRSNKKVWWICNKGHEYLATPNSRAKTGCPYCVNIKICKDNCLEILRPDFLKEFNIKKNGLITPQNIGISSHKKVWWICAKNNKHEWYVSPHCRLKGNTGCPYCKSSNGEKEIENYLKGKKINYKRQIRIDGCKRKNKLPFDFGIYIKNKLLLIEFNGRHHYMPIGFGGNPNENFDLTKESDIIKYNFCIANNIPLLIIHYKDVKNISNLIDSFIKENL